MKMLLNLTIEQIKEIYLAGIKQGLIQDMVEWGASSTGSPMDELIEAVHDIVNQGKTMEQEDYVDYGVIRSWIEYNE